MTDSPRRPNLIPFAKGDERTQRAARLGGLTTSAQRRKSSKPYQGSILDAMDDAGLTGSTWSAWRTFWRAAFGLPLAGEHLPRFHTHTQRDTPPTRQVSEAWCVAGRGAGKSRNAALGGLFGGIRFDNSTLAPGELALIPIIAANTDQARVCLSYLKALAERPAFRPYVHRVLKSSIELRTGVNVEVMAASFRTLRGYSIPCAVCDEIAFWAREGDSLNPDHEIVDSIRPGLGRVDGSLLLAISSPYGRKGELWEVYDRSYRRDDDHVLVWNSSTLAMNATYQQWRIERAFQDDARVAAAEYGSGDYVSFRTDVEAFLDPDAVLAVTLPDRRELAPVPGVRYFGFTDPSGGSQDSFTLAIAHREGDRAVLDCVRERKPPFSPDSIVEEFADVLRSYGVFQVMGDRYSGAWVAERFRQHAIRYMPSEKVKSALYTELLPNINSARVELLDLPQLRQQLLSLERRVSRGGKDSIDHPPGAKDDLANAAAGALVLALPATTPAKRIAAAWTA